MATAREGMADEPTLELDGTGPGPRPEVMAEEPTRWQALEHKIREGTAHGMPRSFALLNWRTWLVLSALGVALWLVIAYAALLFEILCVIFGAVLLSLAIRPIADAAGRWHISRSVVVIGVYLGLAVTLVVVSNLLVAIVSTEVGHLQSKGPAMLQAVISRVAGTSLIRFLPSADSVAQGLMQQVDALARATFATLTSFGSLLLDVFLVLILAFFFVADGALGSHLVDAWVPISNRSHVREILSRLRTRLTRWIWAQMAIACYFGIVFSIGLSLLRIPSAFGIGFVGGFLEMVPYAGGAIALLLAVVSAITVRPVLAVWVVVFYLVVVEVESHVVAPALYGRVLGLHPAVVVLALFVGAKVGGILGLLFAAPFIVVIAALFREVQSHLASGRADDTDDVVYPGRDQVVAVGESQGLF